MGRKYSQWFSSARCTCKNPGQTWPQPTRRQSANHVLKLKQHLDIQLTRLDSSLMKTKHFNLERGKITLAEMDRVENSQLATSRTSILFCWLGHITRMIHQKLTIHLGHTEVFLFCLKSILLCHTFLAFKVITDAGLLPCALHIKWYNGTH